MSSKSFVFIVAILAGVTLFSFTPAAQAEEGKWLQLFVAGALNPQVGSSIWNVEKIPKVILNGVEDGSGSIPAYSLFSASAGVEAGPKYLKLRVGGRAKMLIPSWSEWKEKSFFETYGRYSHTLVRETRRYRVGVGSFLIPETFAEIEWLPFVSLSTGGRYGFFAAGSAHRYQLNYEVERKWEGGWHPWRWRHRRHDDDGGWGGARLATVSQTDLSVGLMGKSEKGDQVWKIYGGISTINSVSDGLVITQNKPAGFGGIAYEFRKDLAGLLKF